MTTGRATRRGSIRTSRSTDASSCRGDLIGVDGETVRIDVKGLGETAIPFAAIRNAKLLMTDRLIAATAPLTAADDETDVEIEIEEEGQD